eukprot:4629669-Pleurochrysis_carterae.AAC.2
MRAAEPGLLHAQKKSKSLALGRDKLPELLASERDTLPVLTALCVRSGWGVSAMSSLHLCGPTTRLDGFCRSVGDWPCSSCGNWNWARRKECNQCRVAKDGMMKVNGSDSGTKRLGQGGG